MKKYGVTFTVLFLVLLARLASANLITVNFNDASSFDSSSLNWSITNVTTDGKLFVGSDVLTVSALTGEFIWKGAEFYGNHGEEITVVGYNNGEVVFNSEIDLFCSDFRDYRSNVAIDTLIIYGGGNTSLDNFKLLLADNDCYNTSFGGLFIDCGCESKITPPHGGCDGPTCPVCPPCVNPPPPVPPPPSPVPEPSTLVLLGTGLLALGHRMKKRAMPTTK